MNKKLIFLLIFLFALQVSFAQNPIFKETKLFTLDNGEKVLKGNVYENGSWYLITEKNNKQSLIINGKREGWFEKVYEVKFTEDGKRYAYIVQKELSEEEIDPLNPFKQGKFYVVIDGVKGEEFDYIIENSFIMTSDGKVAYIASNGGEWFYGKYSGGKWFVVVNGEKGKEFDYIDKDSLKFTPDGKIVFVASNGGKWKYDGRYYDGKWYVVVNGVKGEEFYYIDEYSLTFTPDGKVAYVASNYGKRKDNKYSSRKYFIIVDSQKSKPYNVFYKLKYLKEKDTLIALARDGNDILLVEYVNTK